MGDNKDNRKPDQSTTHFGYRDVSVADKQRLVGQVFTSVADRYDLMNDLMSMGVHRVWKRHFVASAGIRRGDRVLDLAGGTGDIAALMAPKVGSQGQIVLADINAAMLGNGRDRMMDLGHIGRTGFAQANAEVLPFAASSFDLVTMAFGLRNVTNKDQALRSIREVLKPGGRLLVLEFSRVRSDTLRPLYDWYSFNVLPRLGARIAADADSYRYLAESIRKHPDQQGLQAMMETAGFVQCSHRNLSGGMVAIHSGVRP